MTAWAAIGWIGNGFYFSRFLLQWLQSERARRSVTPSVFWWLSLGGVLFLGSYALHEEQAILIPAFCINGAIYVRNLWLHYRHGKGSRLGPIPAACIGLGLMLVLFLTGGATAREALAENPFVLAVGIGGQAFWSTRFILQWWFSERAGRSYFPDAFWWFSLAGGILNITYMSFLGDWVLIASVALTPLYPIRNLMLEHARSKREREVSPPAPDRTPGSE